jgi:hypothetical protein
MQYAPVYSLRPQLMMYSPSSSDSQWPPQFANLVAAFCIPKPPVWYS